MLLDVGSLARELDLEVAALERGEAPFAGREGNHWRTLEGTAASAVPFRVYAPGSALKQAKPLPVVIAFHGMGGDENMFLYGYGGGELARQADRLGFLAVTPRSEPFLRDPRVFDRLLAQLKSDYSIDASRIYVLGHSMGTGAVTRLAATRHEEIAAAVCIAGGSGAGHVPTLAIRGALDAFGFMARGGSKQEHVTSLVLENWGHTLVVGDRLGFAFDWLATQVKPKLWY